MPDGGNPAWAGRHAGATVGFMEHTRASVSVDRRPPPWWAVLLVQAAGLWAAFFCVVFAYFSLPAVGLFGVANDPGSRLGGALAALAFGPALLSGPLLVGLVRRDGRWLWPTAGVASGLSLLVLVVGLSG